MPRNRHQRTHPGLRPHHQLATTGGWITRKRKDGTTEWLPQPTSTMDNPAPTVTFTPKNSCTTATKTIHEREAQPLCRGRAK